MNNYIIDPMAFYMMNIASSLKTVCTAFAVAFGFAFVGLICGCIYNLSWLDSENNQRYYKLCKRWAIVSGILLLLFIIGAVVIPDKSTCIEMMIAKAATYGNVEWTVDQVKEIVDYIVKALKGAS